MNKKTRRRISWPYHIGHTLAVYAMFAALCAAPGLAVAAPEDEIRAAFQQFVGAQNAHDVEAVEGLLLASPDFLWITRGAPIWGKDAALRGSPPYITEPGNLPPTYQP